MVPAFLAFVLVNCVLVRLPVVPDLDLLLVGLPVSLAGLRFRRCRVLAATLVSAVMTAAVIDVEMQRRLAAGHEIERLRGTVCSLPREKPEAISFVFCPEEREGVRYQLTWYQPVSSPKPGERWQLSAKLFAPTGSVNFDLFDYEQWLFARRIHGRGYVRSVPEPLRLSETLSTVHAWRYVLRQRLLGLAPPHEAATLLALSLGDTSQLAMEEWDVLRLTGTTHLLVVSGLHVGLLSGLLIVVLRSFGMPLIWVSLTALGFSGGYAILAGFGLPVQRAWIMTGVVLLGLGLARQLRSGFQLLLALIAVIIIDPLASLGQGFWLSFGAVSALVYGLHRGVMAQTLGQRFMLAARVQWTVFIGLIVPLAWLVQQVPVGSLLINVLAVPWVGLVVVPVLFLGLLALPIDQVVATQLLNVSAWQVAMLWDFLHWCAAQQLIVAVPRLDAGYFMLGLFGSMLLLMPRGLVPRWPGLLLVILLFRPYPALPPGMLRLTFLDVGQGLSVLVETGEQLVVYDTGPSYISGSSAAARTVLPTIKQHGRSHVDHLIISHGDDDHAGGKDFLVDHLSIGRLHQQSDCRATWESGDTVFRVFRVSQGSLQGNNSSCLLDIVHGEQRILLTGDIEEEGEYVLVQQGMNSDKAWQGMTVISAPHHGSDSSSTPAILNRLQPEYVVVSAGYQNRFGHPHDNVMNRYQNRQIKSFNTAVDGAVKFHLDRRHVQVMTARADQPFIWRRREHHDTRGNR